MNGPDDERVEEIGVVLQVEPMCRLKTTDAFRPDWILSGRVRISRTAPRV